MTAKKGIVLFGHGARDPQWAEPMQGLQRTLQQKMPEVPVALAFLELMAPALPEAVEGLIKGGAQAIQIVPIFFGRGGHLKNDFPLLMKQMCDTYPEVAITATSAVGHWDIVWESIAKEIVGGV